MPEAGTVLVLGSAPDVVRCRDWRRDGIDVIVAINNAWLVRPDWDRMVHPKDFPDARRPTDLAPGQTLHSYPEYVPAVNAHGGFVYCGGTMAFTAAYWVLEALRPRVIAFLGCDMTYAATGSTHFYGRGTADPLRDDPTLQSLEAKSARVQMRAAARGCAVVNLSENETSRLVFPRRWHELPPDWRDATRDAVLAPLSDSCGGLVAAAEAREAELDYRVPSGKYWKELDRFDPQALREVDALWLAAARGYAAAAAAPGLTLAVT